MNTVFLLLFTASLICLPVFLIWAFINLIKKRSSKKVFKRAGISALILVFSLIGFGLTMETVDVESIELAIPDYQNEYDVNTNIPVSVIVNPEDATVSDLEFETSSSSITFREDEIVTGEEEGTFEVLVRCGDIESNTLTISVVDITAREEALAAAEAQKQAALEAAEQARKEAEAQKLAKEQAEREAEEKRLAEEQAEREAEEKRLAEEQAEKEAEEKRLAAERAA